MTDEDPAAYLAREWPRLSPWAKAQVDLIVRDLTGVPLNVATPDDVLARAIRLYRSSW